MINIFSQFIVTFPNFKNIQTLANKNRFGWRLVAPSEFWSTRSAGLLFLGVWLHPLHSFSDISFQLVICCDNRNLLSSNPD
jgi:hypothetical protein